MNEAYAKVRKIPQRRCTGCGEHFAKNELIRVLRTPEGEIIIDFTGKKSGRGAYICPQPECLKKAQKIKSLERSLEVPIPQEVYDRLAREMEAAGE